MLGMNHANISGKCLLINIKRPQKAASPNICKCSLKTRPLLFLSEMIKKEN